MEEMSVGTVIISEQKENSKNYEKFKSIIKNKKTNIQIVMAGDKITIDEWSYIDRRKRYK